MSTAPRSIRRRRQAATIARRRRLLLVDAILGAGLGLIVLLGFGLAPAGIVALVVLVVCAISYALARRHRARS